MSNNSESERTMSLILKSVEEEAADCRARCAGMKVGDLILHYHHDCLCEILIQPVENLIDYILQSKFDNPALRLRLMGPPIVDAEILADAECKKAVAEWYKAYAPHYARLYPDSPWNGQTIFAGEFKL